MKPESTPACLKNFTDVSVQHVYFVDPMKIDCPTVDLWSTLLVENIYPSYHCKGKFMRLIEFTNKGSLYTIAFY